MRRIILLLLAASALVACADDRATGSADTATAPAAATSPQEATRESTAPPTGAAVPASRPPASGAPEAPVPTSGPVGGAPTPDGDLHLARFNGYGDIPFGAPVADMTRLWGGELKTLGKEFNDQCYFMTPTWTKRPADFSFMISEGRFVRFSTESDNFVAPGGVHVGLTKAEVLRLYPGRVDVQPHKYSDGQYLRVKDPAGGKGVLVMETDGKGDNARVTEWRVGVPPEIDYVEGCA